MRTILGLLAIALLATGCGESSSTTTDPTTVTTSSTPPATSLEQTGFPVTIAASNGGIEIPQRPMKIVSMSASHTEMLFAIGAGEQVIAVDAFSNYPADAPMTELTGFAPNVESIVGYETDLVVTDGDWDGTSMGALTELGIPVVILPAALSLENVYTQIEQLGAATGHIGEAAALVGRMQTDIAEVLESLPVMEEPLTFYHELDATYYSVTSETFIGRIYSSMGLVNIADAVGDGSSGYPQLSEEYILEQDPDLILLADTICCGTSIDTLPDRPGWDALSAVSTGAVVELNDDIASRWGPRVVDHMSDVADAIQSLLVAAG
ncbi:MAG: ABC transporter substrate-binding protein [bacterium]|nr:ABC transporter substrate-binding protein [bacterium]